MKYGLADRVDQEDPLCLMTIKEVAAILGVSPQRVHAIEKNALKKVRAEAIRLGLVEL